MKKLLSVLLTIILIVSIIPLGAFTLTASAATSGYYTYTITGGKATITDVSDKISGNITVPSTLGGYTVTSIGENAFYECDSITKVTIPDSVTSIGNTAFGFCNNLTSVVLPSGIKNINDGVFSDCEKLTEVSIPDGVVSIGDLAFANCASLTNIKIPEGVTNIGDYAFGWCYSLTGITVPDSVTAIGEGVFSFCENLAQVNLGTGVKSVSKSAFYDCKKLTEMVIPKGVTDIGNSAFEGCVKLERVTMPNTIKNIDSYAFNRCDKLNDVWYGGSENNEINIGYYNDCLTSATWHYSMCDKHSYQSSCLFGCTVCGWKPDSHIYVNACDNACNECGFARTVLTHSYSDCFSGYSEELYGSWNITTVTKTGVYTLKPNNNYKGTHSIHNIAVFDKQGKEVKYYEKLGGFPLVKGQKYTVKFRYDCSDEIGGTITWTKTKKVDSIFADTSAKEWYNDPITYSVGRGLISGYGGTNNFGPADNIQRQDFLVILARLDGVDLTEYGNKKSSFPDVPEGSYYEAAINWGAKNGIVTGYQNGKFGVGDKITREQLVTFLCRYAEYKDLDTSYKNSTKQTVSKTYTDYKNVSGWAEEYVLWAIEKGVIKGKTSTTIVPGGNALRCEVAQIMYNIFLNDTFNS